MKIVLFWCLRPCFYPLFFILITSAVSAAVELEPAVNEPSRQVLDEVATISVAVNKNSYPYHFVNDQGQVDGLMVDFWRLWARKQNVEIEFFASNWIDTLSKVRRGEIDIHAGMAVLAQRKQDFDYLPPTFRITNHLYLHRELADFTDIDQLSPFAIGVVANSVHFDHLSKQYPKLVIKTFASRHQLYDAAIQGEISVFAAIGNLSRNHPQYQALIVLFPAYKRLTYNQNRYGSAMAKNNQALRAFILQGLDKITVKEQTEIERAWFGLGKKKDVLSLAFSANLPPYMAVSPSGNPQGLFIDIWRLWSQYSGHKIEFIADEMQGAIERVKQHHDDVHIAYPINNKGLKGLIEAWPLYVVHSQVYVSNRLPNILTLEQLSGKTIGLFSTAPYKAQIEQNYPKLNFRYFSNHADMIKDAESGKVDAMISEVENMNVKLINANLQSSFYLLDQPLFNSKISSMVGKDAQKLAGVIKEGFEKIPIKKLIALEQKWLSRQKQTYFEELQHKVKLSSNEQQWINEHPVIKVGMVKNWSPMEFVNEQGQFAGINRDVLDLIALRTKISFEYQAFDNWQVLYQALLDNQVDMLTGSKPNEQRNSVLLFTQSYWEMPWVILHPRHIGKQSSIRYFIGKKLAIVRGYQLIPKLRDRYPDIMLRLVDTDEEGLLAVQQGRVDGFIETLAATSELLKRESLVSLMISVVEEHNIEYSHMAIRKDWPALKNILDKGIMSFSDRESQRIYERWFGVDLNTGFDKNVVLRVAAQAGFIIFIILVVIMLWNRRLQVEINRSKALKIQMNHMATHDELTGLANRVLLKEQINSAIAFHQRQELEMAVLFIDLDGFKGINDNYGHDVGDELLEQLAKRLLLCVRKSDTVARFGGDEFVMVLTGLHHKNEAAFIADKILNQAQRPFNLSAVSANIGCSIGIALYPQDGSSESELLKVADTLMYKVKSNGKNHYSFA